MNLLDGTIGHNESQVSWLFNARKMHARKMCRHFRAKGRMCACCCLMGCCASYFFNTIVIEY